MNRSPRLARLAAELASRRLDAILLTHLPNIRYLCGFTGSAAAVVITSREAFLFTDGRYRQQAQSEVQDCQIKIGTGAPLAQAAKWLSNRSSMRRIGIEAGHLTVAEHSQLGKAVHRRSRLVEAPGLVEEMRMLKDAREIELIRAACQ